MPVREIHPARSPEREALVRELLAEWSYPTANPEPVVLEQFGPDHKLVHVYVVWDKWRQLDGVERSEIIMEAAEKRAPREYLNVTIAMGLTPEEADRFGIKWR